VSRSGSQTESREIERARGLTIATGEATADRRSLLLSCFGVTPRPTSARFSLFANRESGRRMQPLRSRPSPAEKAPNLSDSLSPGPKRLTPKTPLGRRMQPPDSLSVVPICLWIGRRAVPRHRRHQFLGLDFAPSMALNMSSARAGTQKMGYMASPIGLRKSRAARAMAPVALAVESRGLARCC